MLRRVLRLRAIVNPSKPDDSAEAEFIRRGLPSLLSATEGLRQFCYLSRHQTGCHGERDAVWLVCKPRRGKVRELEEAGRSALSKAVASGVAYDSRVEQDTDEGALAEVKGGIKGVPRIVPYEVCWRYLDAATRVALEVLAAPGVEHGAIAVNHRVAFGALAKLGVGEHLAHFLWNALGLQEAALEPRLAVPNVQLGRPD